MSKPCLYINNMYTKKNFMDTFYKYVHNVDMLFWENFKQLLIQVKVFFSRPMNLQDTYFLKFFQWNRGRTSKYQNSIDKLKYLYTVLLAEILVS